MRVVNDNRSCFVDIDNDVINDNLIIILNDVINNTINININDNRSHPDNIITSIAFLFPLTSR